VAYKLSAWHDVGWWQLSLQERPAVPHDPASFTAIQASDEWAAALDAGAPLLKL
jgi:phosphinothricin acetyltransferase